MTTRYVIVGSGVAGVAAAAAIRQRDPRGDITLLSDDPHGYYSRPGLAYFLTGEIPEAQLFPMRPAVRRELGLRQVIGAAHRVDPAEHRVILADGAALTYDRLLLATGAVAVRSPVPGAELPGVVKLDGLDDARQLVALARRARAAVVIGGGITALEIAEGLHAHCRQVHYLLRGDRYWGSVLDAAEAEIIMGRLAAAGIQLHTRTEAAEIAGGRGRVAGVVTTDGRRIPCDLVAVAIGVTPRVELAHAAGLRVERGILADEFLQTSAADIFTAGDAAQVYDPATGKALLDTLWNAARSQGHVAGQNMAGGQVRYVKPMPLNVTRLVGVTTTIIGAVGRWPDADMVGLARGDSETWRQLGQALVAEDRHEVNRIRLLVGSRTLLGAVVMGDQTPSRPLQRLVGEQVDITPIRERLLASGAPIAALIAQLTTGPNGLVDRWGILE
jgi:NADPH-dependent 2,4-dienoyl-CoA reductase/sulfur reductase-like enzyme